MDGTVTLKAEKRQGRKRPVVHVLMPDGRVSEFKGRAIVVPEGGDDVLAVLINSQGEMYVTPDGKPAVVAVPVVGLGVAPDPAKWLSWKAMAKRAGVSLSTAKRMAGSGELPKPEKLGKRKVGFRQGDVDQAVSKLKGY